MSIAAQERIFERIAAELNGGVRNAARDQQLLTDMARPILELRPAVTEGRSRRSGPPAFRGPQWALVTASMAKQPEAEVTSVAQCDRTLNRSGKSNIEERARGVKLCLTTT